MKVLFVASNPASEGAINLEGEISALQTVFGKATGDPIILIARPRTIVADLSEAILQYRPDILHITAHGDQEKLAMQNEVGDRRLLTAQSLLNLLGDHRPRLVYLNACNSHEIASALVSHVDVAIGSSAPISNRAARDGAVNFYRQIVSGASVTTAYDAARSSVEVEQGDPSLVIETRKKVDPDTLVLHRNPQLLARIKIKGSGSGSRRFDVRFGLSGCPANTIHLVIFTDDADWANNSENWESDLSTVVRKAPLDGVIWSDTDDVWSVEQEMRIFVAGVTANGDSFIIGTTVAQAIEQFALTQDTLPQNTLNAVAQELRRRRGR